MFSRWSNVDLWDSHCPPLPLVLSITIAVAEIPNGPRGPHAGRLLTVVPRSRRRSLHPIDSSKHVSRGCDRSFETSTSLNLFQVLNLVQLYPKNLTHERGVLV
jgi:hypothetical protein